MCKFYVQILILQVIYFHVMPFVSGGTAGSLGNCNRNSMQIK